MRLFQFGILCFVSLATVQCQDGCNGTTVVHHGLKEHGAHVCSLMKTIYQMCNDTIQQQTVVTVTTRGSWGRTITKKKIKTITKIVQVPKQVEEKHLFCCGGWTKENGTSGGTSGECTKAICSIECRNGGLCVAPDTCECKDGFEGKYCETVRDECHNKEYNHCEQICVQHGPGHRCECRRGWRINKEDLNKCDDINECEGKNPPCKCKDPNDTQCKSTCINLPGSYGCKCAEGYYLNSAEECEDINECVIHPGICDQICENTPGSYLCKCLSGFELDEKSGKCVDIDECKHNNGNCSDTCVNIEGSYICTCPKGFYLDKDKHTCLKIKPTMKNVVICQTDLVGQIDCGSYEEKIMIIDAMYGRLTKDYCQYGNYTQDLRCTSKVSPLKPIQAACDNQASCVILLEESIFGDPCPYIEKYMQVTYDCTK